MIKYDALRLYTPYYTANQSMIYVFQNWQNPAHTSICKVNGVHFDDVYLKTQISALYNPADTLIVATSYSGDLFVVKTDQNNYVLIKVVQYENSQTGTATIQLKR